MAVQFDDQGLRLIGLGERHIDFYDDDGDVVASIYLDQNGNLNIGGIQLSTSDGGEGSTVDLASVPFLAIAANDLLQNERVFVAGDGLQATDEGGGNNYTVRLGTPGTLSAQSAAAVTAASHTHPITASSNPGSNEFILKSTASGGLTLQQLNVDNIRLDGNTLSAQSGDLTLTAAGGDVVLPSAINIGADNFVSQLTGWRVSYGGAADFRSIFADELHVKAFVADIEQALAGGQIISKSVAILSRDFVVPFQGAITGASTADDYFQVAGDQTGVIYDAQTFSVNGSTGNDGNYTVASTTYFSGIDRTRIYTNEAVPDGTADGEVRCRELLYVEDLPGFADTQVFASGDWVRLRVIDRSGGGLVVADAWGRVFSYQDESGGEQRWSYYAQDSSTVAGDTVNAGAIALDYGASGDGWHEITALDSDGPYARIVTWETDPTNSANYTLRSQIGNLDGITDSDFPSIGGWGLYSTSAYLKGIIEAAGGDVVIGDDGIRIDGTIDGGQKYIRWSGPSGDLFMGTTIDSGNNITGGTIDVNDVSGSLLTLVADKISLNAGTYNRLAGNTVIAGSSSAATPSYRLDVQANVSDYMARFFNDGGANRLGIIIQAGPDSNPAGNFIRFNDGDGDAIGSIQGDNAGGIQYNTTSDERAKQDITPMSGALSKILALEPISYRGRGAPQSQRKLAGLVAQRVQGVLPELVSEMDGMLSLNYTGVIPYLIGAVQDLHRRLEALEAR